MRIKIGEPQFVERIILDLFPEVQFEKINGISIDSRKIEQGDIYLPIIGENIDGHDFIDDAIKSGAVLVFSEKDIDADFPIIRVQSTKKTLLVLAKQMRQYFDIPFIGITGSNGKTTNKELLFHVLSDSFDCWKTDQNFNSTIGLPMSLFALEKRYELAIVEMGISSPNEMSLLAETAQPTSGLITNIHPVHTEFFQQIEDIASEKEILFSSLPEDGIAFVNADDPFISKMTTTAKKVTIGFKENVDYFGKYLAFTQNNVLKVNGISIHLHFSGRIMAQNALSVFAVAHTLGIDRQKIKDKIESFTLPQGRGGIVKRSSYIIVNDTYNANLFSAKSGVSEFVKFLPAQRHFIIIGDMFELGHLAIPHHQELGKFISKLQVDFVLGVGDLTYHLIDQLQRTNIICEHFQNKSDLITKLRELLNPGDVIYIKGSRGMKMETIIEKAF